MSRNRLPIGIQDFRTIREGGFYYVDKTPLVRDLVDQGRSYFLSRPRRFGKSLLVDTLKSLFEGREELFRGLDIHGQWNWSARHPVLRLSLGGTYGEPGEIEGDIIEQLESIERHHDLAPARSTDTGSRRLRNILGRLHHTTGQQVVVLVDEYDKPILDVLEDPDLAKANRDYLRGFYGIIKDSAKHVRFVFITGVSMFSKVSLFSGLNNLEDISLDPQYATICGYTDADLDTVFAPELPGLDRAEIRRWYNGYHWRGGERVYNPFDILPLFRNREFRPWWFETGSPTFLYRTLVDRRVSPMALENRVTDAGLVSKFDVEDIGTDALLFQTGYLTIADESWDGVETLYTLDYPNFEVCRSLNHGLLEYATRRGREAVDRGKELARHLAENDFDGFGERLQAYLSEIPHQWYDGNEIERYEAHYAGMLYMAFRSMGLDLRAEDSSSHGRSDLVVFHEGQVFVLEFKMVRSEGEGDTTSVLVRAIAQMRDRGYAKKHRDRGEPIHLVGMAFGGDKRNLVGVRAERL